MPINKVVASADDAVADIHDGATLMISHFGGPGGMPERLIEALVRRGARNLTLIGNTAGISNFGALEGQPYTNVSALIENGQVKKVLASFPAPRSPSTPNPFEKLFRAGKIELELVPQGTLAERIRAGGAGIGGFYTPTGVGTLVAHGKEERTFDGRRYLLELPLRADFALVRAYKADAMGNLVYRGTSRSFGAVMATAAEVTIAEVDEVLPVGQLDPEAIVTPGIYVKRVVVRAKEPKR